MKEKNPHYILPAVLIDKLDRCIEENPPDLRSPGKRENYKYKYEYFLFFINMILLFSIKNNENSDGIKNGCSISTGFLQHIKDNYRAYLQYLESQGLIIIYHVGSKETKQTNWYKINEEYLRGEWRVVPITNAKLIKRVRSMRIENLPASPLYAKLWEYLHRLKVNDFMAAYEFIDKKYSPNSMKNFIRKRFVLDFLSSNLYMNKGKKVNRVYSTFTFMPSELRSFLNFDGEALAECDVKSCQLVTLLIFYKEHLKKEGIEQMPEDAERFAHMIQKGSDVDIYVYLMDKLEPMGVVVGSRKEFKDEMFFPIINGPVIISKRRKGREGEKPIKLKEPKKKKELPSDDAKITKKTFYTWRTNDEYISLLLLRNLLSDEFPSIIAFLDKMKTPTHKGFTKIMNDMEALIIIETIAERIIRERPDVKIATCHDAIYCATRHAGYVKSVIEEEYQKGFGVVPKVVVSLLVKG